MRRQLHGLRTIIDTTGGFSSSECVMADIDMRAVAGERGIEAGRSDLVAKLDELLERYLHTLDTYQKAREELAKELSSVRHELFLSLLDGVLFVLMRCGA